MTRRSLQRFSQWLLPLLLLRAFVPAGFMVSAAASGLQLRLCPAQVSMPAAPNTKAGHEHHAHHPMGGTADHAPAEHPQHGTPLDPHAGHHSGKHFESPCPFGMAVMALATTVPTVSGPFSAITDDVLVADDLPVPSTGPIRAESIRGPPSFS